MCCFTSLFLVLISRIGIVYWWLANPQSHDLPFKTWVLPNVPVIPGWHWVLVGAMTGKYQPAERKFQFSQRMRELWLDLGFTVTVLSRLPLVMHDPDLLQSGH
jgi:hypothetical protein